MRAIYFSEKVTEKMTVASELDRQGRDETTVTQITGAPPRDLIIQGPAEHGILRLVSVGGIESPGLTALLAPAELVAETIGLG